MVKFTKKEMRDIYGCVYRCRMTSKGASYYNRLLKLEKKLLKELR